MYNLTYRALSKPGVPLKTKLHYIKQPRMYVPDNVQDFKQNMESIHRAWAHYIVNRSNWYQATIFIQNVCIRIQQNQQKQILAAQDLDGKLAAICEMYDDTGSQKVFWLPKEVAITGFEDALKDNIEVDNEVLLLHLRYNMEQKHAYVVDYHRRRPRSDDNQRGRRLTIEEIVGLIFGKPVPVKA